MNIKTWVRSLLVVNGFWSFAIGLRMYHVTLNYNYGQTLWVNLILDFGPLLILGFLSWVTGVYVWLRWAQKRVKASSVSTSNILSCIILCPLLVMLAGAHI